MADSLISEGGAREGIGLRFLDLPGAAARQIRDHNWSGTALGPPADWAPELKALTAVVLAANQPMFLVWGREGLVLHNDALTPILGNKYPGAMGRSALGQVWSEAREALAPLFDRVYAGEAVHMRDFALMLDRNGRLEEAHFSFSYTPARNAAGEVAGFLCVCNDITDQVLSDRRQLADQRRRHREFEQAPGFMIIMQGPDHIVEFVNDAHRRLFASDNWVGRPIRAAFPAIEHQGFFESLDDVYTTGETFRARDAEVRFRRTPDAPEEIHYLDFVYAALRDTDGTINGIACQGLDNTDSRLSESALRASQDELKRVNETLRKSERALREREAELARVQQIAHVGGLTVDLVDGFRNRRSPEYLAIHGLPPDAANETHESWVQRIHPNDRVHAEREFLDAIAGTSETYTAQYRIIRPSDGATRWIAVRARLERDAEGRAVRLRGAHIDITDRMLVQESLRESEERFRLIADSAPVPIWVTKLGGQRAFANRAYLDFLGVNYEEALVYDWRKALHPDDLDRILREQVGGETSLKPFVLEARYRRADGEWRWLRSESQPRRDPLGNHIGFIGVAHDITLAKQAEEELRRLNDVLSVQVARRTRERDQIWNVSQDLMLVLDAQGEWIALNPAWHTTTGWDEDALIGPYARPTPALLRAQGKLTRNLLKNRSGRFDIQLPHRDGSVCWISWTSTTDDDAIYAVGRDVTAEKDAQEALRNAEEALRQSQKLEAMGQLTGGVAHDFNNLLMPIIGGLDMLQRRGLGNEREQRLVAGALQSAERAKTLVHRLLAFARRQPLQAIAVDIGQLVIGMAELIESTTGPQIKVVVDVAPDIAPAKADPNQLEMAILNLSVNARDAMTQGGTLRISAGSERIRGAHRSKLPPGAYVQISVADTGSGMDDAVLGRAIEPFFSTKGIGKGTGLGLSMVHGLATQLGGALTISSKPGMGTNVELWLPVSDTAAGLAAAEPVGDSDITSGIALLVDDEDMVRMSTADMLSELGFTVHECTSAQSALRTLETGLEVDLLVTDHLMPGMTGVELAHLFRGLRPRVPVLIISGFAESDGIAPDLPRLTKPFRQSDLAASIAQLVPGPATR